MTRPPWLTGDRERMAKRALKVAIAAALATGVAQLLGLPYPLFATLSAIVTLEITVRTSLRTSRNALIGAAVGAMIGFGGALLGKEQMWSVAVAALLSYFVLGWLGMEPAGRQAAVVAVLIVLIPAPTDEQLSVLGDLLDVTINFDAPGGEAVLAAVRFAETVIGVLAALLVNRFVFPPRASRGVRRRLSLAYGHLAAMYRLVMDAEATGEHDRDAVIAERMSYRAQMREIDELWAEALDEGRPAGVLSGHWRAVTRRIWEQCAAMDDAVVDAMVRAQLEPVRSEIAALALATSQALDQVAAALATMRADLPTFPELESTRRAMLEAMLRLEGAERNLDFTELLQAFTFVNGMVTIAQRLGELAPSSRPISRSEPATEVVAR